MLQLAGFGAGCDALRERSLRWSLYGATVRSVPRSLAPREALAPSRQDRWPLIAHVTFSITGGSQSGDAGEHFGARLAGVLKCRWVVPDRQLAC